jgi:hypothetical protein
MTLRLSFLCLFLWGGNLLADKVMIDGTGASVGKKLITVQDGYFYRSLQRFHEGAPSTNTLEQGEELKRTIQRMAFEDMVSSEMKSFEFEGDQKEAVDKAFDTSKAKTREALARWLVRYGKSEREAREQLLKTLNVEKFLQKKVETLTPIITDAEVEKYYKQNQTRFQGTDLESLRGNILVLLKKERMQKGLEEWVRFLKEKYGVTTLIGG